MLESVTTAHLISNGIYNDKEVQISENNQFHYITTRTKKICVILFHYVFLEFTRNNCYIILRYKIISILASTKKNLVYILRM